MDSVIELQQLIKNLSPDLYQKFKTWFDEFDSEKWDKQFEQDVTKGTLDHLAEEAISDLKSGNGSKI